MSSYLPLSGQKAPRTRSRKERKEI